MPSSCTLRGQRAEPVGPDRRVDDPIAEARRVVTAAQEPAVVEHEPLDADRGRAFGERDQLAGSWSKYTASHVLRVSGRGVERMLRRGPQPACARGPRAHRDPASENTNAARGAVVLVAGLEHDLARVAEARRRRPG